MLDFLLEKGNFSVRLLHLDALHSARETYIESENSDQVWYKRKDEKIVYRLWKKRLEKIKVEVYIFTKYVDDTNIAVSVIPKGWLWRKHPVDDWTLIWDEEQEKRDKEGTESDEEWTFRLI